MKESLTIGIIVIGYNRVSSIERLLDRLNVCDYPYDNVPLVISLDNCGKTDVFDHASSFVWRHGFMDVLLQPERLGCKKHVLKCGTYIERYNWDAAIVLEDDVYPAEAFYQYALQAVEKYRSDDRVAGISLYAMPQNQTIRLPFAPALSEYDAYFMQLAQSCGQVWMRTQWGAFDNWYCEHNDSFTECPGVPPNVCRWPETSWLKYHIRYCVEKDKYFVYPYQSLTTNFSDVGQHTGVSSNALQTRLQQETKTAYSFPELDNAPVIYDVWHENLGLARLLDLAPDSVCIDIFGGKQNYENKRFWLTSLAAPFKVVRSFGLSLFPMDMNVICDLKGDQVFLYDTTESADAPAVMDRDLQMWGYYNRILFPDEMIWKLSKPIGRRIRKQRKKLLLHPAELAKLFYKRIRNR